MWLGGLLLMLAAAVQAADFRVTDTEGRTHTLSGYKGKWVLVNYWATWCPPCLEEIPDLIALHGNRKNNLVVIGIAMDYRDPKHVTEFADSMLVDYPIVLGDKDVVRQIGPVQGLPTTYLFNPDGKMVAQQVGAVTREMVEQYIASRAPAAKTKK
jgi:thiol-disulfide isomerase/thioredoxin